LGSSDSSSSDSSSSDSSSSDSSSSDSSSSDSSSCARFRGSLQGAAFLGKLQQQQLGQLQLCAASEVHSLGSSDSCRLRSFFN